MRPDPVAIAARENKFAARDTRAENYTSQRPSSGERVTHGVREMAGRLLLNDLNFFQLLQIIGLMLRLAHPAVEVHAEVVPRIHGRMEGGNALYTV